MKSINKFAVIIAAAGLASVAGAQEIHNWRNVDGQVWKNVDGQCWRDASWTPATAAPGCGGDVKPAPVQATPVAAPVAAAPVAAAPAAEAAAPAAAPAPVAAPAPAPAPAPKAAPAPVKVTYAAEAYFDSNKSVLKSDAKAQLDDLVTKVKAINLEVIIAVGHVDSSGPAKPKAALSLARADAVKAYLVSKGIEKNRVYTEGKGDTQPVADNKTVAGRTKNRRVEIEVVGTRAAQ